LLQEWPCGAWLKLIARMLAEDDSGDEGGRGGLQR
jgi:hypothetical protein